MLKLPERALRVYLWASLGLFVGAVDSGTRDLLCLEASEARETEVRRERRFFNPDDTFEPCWGAFSETISKSWSFNRSSMAFLLVVLLL